VEIRQPLRHQPYYCEENAWWLCQDPGLAALEPRVVFVSNAGRTCLLEHQRAGGASGEVVWDYHAFVIAHWQRGWWVWDPDTTLATPERAAVYLASTFATARRLPELAPRFRVVDAERFVARFATDRSHMRAPDGAWLYPPPDWPPAQAGGESMNLMAYVDVSLPFEGELFDLVGLEERYAGDLGGQKV